MRKFGDTLKKLRQEKGLSQEELAKIFNTGKASICNYEKNIRLPDAQKIAKYADYFGVSVDYMLGRTENKNINILEDDKLPESLRGIVDAVGIAMDSGLSSKDIQEILYLHSKINKKN